jgi:hypothetical protein
VEIAQLNPTMRSSVIAALLASCVAGNVFADALPEHLVGVWATDSAIFKGQLLLEGEALYLGADGVGAVVGAPPTIGIKVIASFDPAAGTLMLNILEHEKIVGHGAASYEAGTASVSFGDPSHPLFHRRFEDMAPATLKALGL